MARLISSGFEIYAAGTAGELAAGPDGDKFGFSTVSRVTTGQRSGASCLRITTSGATGYNAFSLAGVNGRGYWARAYIKIGSLPSSNLRILLVSDSINTTQGVFLDTTGRVYHSNATGTFSASINDGAWHRIETYTFFSATQASRAWELRVDGTTISSGTAQTTDALAPGFMYLGWAITNTADIYFDDVALNDDQLTVLTLATDNSTFGLLGDTTPRTKLAQTFRGNGGNVKSVTFQIASIVGTPADGIRMSICSDGGTAPGAELGAVTLASPTTGSQTWTFSTPIPVSANTVYWIVMERTGAISAANYWNFFMGAASKEMYPSGNPFQFNGSAWSAYGTNSDFTGTMQFSGVQDSWPGDGYVILLVPNVDNARGSWTGGAGGTTNLWDALNNIPPVGAVAPGTNTSQISANAVATTGKFDTTSYTTAGATAGHTAILCHVVACHGEQVATGTKSGSASTDTAVNNTPFTTSSFSYGLDVGAEGAWPTNWRWSVGTAIDYATQPTLSSGARLNIVTTTTSRVADCCFLGLYVEMQPAAPPAARHKDPILNAGQQSVMRAAVR